MKIYNQKSQNHLLLISISEFFGFIFNFIILFLLTRLFNPNDFAYYSFIINFVSFLTIFANFGLGTTLIQKISKNIIKNHKLVQKLISEGFKLIMIFTLIITLLLILSSNLIERLYDITGLGFGLIIASLYLFTTNLIFYFEYVFQGLLNFKYYCISKISLNLFKMLIVFINFIVKLTIIQVIFLFSLVSLIQFLIIIIFVQIKYKLLSKLTFINKSLSKELIKFSIFIFLPELFLYIITNFNQFILAYYVNSTELANFLLVLNLIQALSIPIFIFSKMVFPFISYYFHNPELKVRKVPQIFNAVFKFGLFIMIPISFYFFFFSDYFMFILFGTNYSIASNYLKVFIFYLNIKMIDVVAGNFLWATGEQKLVFMLYAINSVLTVLLSILLIPLFSAYGAIISIIIPHSGYILYSILVVKKREKIHLDFKVKLSIFKFILSSLLSLVILFSFNLIFKFNLNYTIILFIFTSLFFCLYFILSIIFKAISLTEIKDFRTHFSISK